MTEAKAKEPLNQTELKLQIRDKVLLPLTSLLTVCILLGSTELIGRLNFRSSKTALANCLTRDARSGVRGIPNSVCWEKIEENQPVEYRFNVSGHRSAMECAPKKGDTYRIVVIGSSIALGEYVQREESFAALLPAEILRRSGRNIEVYNEAMGWGGPQNVILRFDDVMQAQPDVILWVLTPWDVQSVLPPPAPRSASRYPGLLGETRYRVVQAFQKRSLSDVGTELVTIVHDLSSGTGTAFLLRHLLFQSQSEYLKAALKGGLDSGFLKEEPDAGWVNRLQQFSLYDGGIEARAQSAGVLLVAALVPNRAQAAMISLGEWQNGFDPYRLNNELRSIITGHGGSYIDILPAYRAIPNPERQYFPVNGHPNANGHATIARVLADELTGGAVPELRPMVHSEFPSRPDR